MWYLIRLIHCISWQRAHSILFNHIEPDLTICPDLRNSSSLKINLFIFTEKISSEMWNHSHVNNHNHCDANNGYYSTNWCHLLSILNHIIAPAVHWFCTCHTVGACCKLSCVCERSATHRTTHTVRRQWWKPGASRGMTLKGCPGDWSHSHPDAESAGWRSWSHP